MIPAGCRTGREVKMKKTLNRKGDKVGLIRVSSFLEDHFGFNMMPIT